MKCDKGVLNYLHVGRVMEEIHQWIMDDDVILDMEGVTAMDSSGAGVILSAHKQGLHVGHGFSVMHCCPNIMRHMALTRLDRIIVVI